MLKQDEINKRIESRRKPKAWFEARMDGLAGLDKETRTIGCLLLGCDEKQGSRLPDTRKRWEATWRAARQLLRLDESAPIQLGKTLFPQFSTEFEIAWKLHRRLPYQSGSSRRPFRAADRPDLLRPKQVDFLVALLNLLDGLDEDLPWIAAHAAHLGVYQRTEHIGLLLAAAIERGGSRAANIEDILRQSAEGTHEVGQMGRHLTTAFLCSSNQACWEYVEKLLLAAQRQEGLRQVILESVDFSHPDAFRRMLRLILDENLVRFSATVRAADVWLDMPLDSQSSKYVGDVLQSISLYLHDDTARSRALSGDDPEAAYLALWSTAFEDAPSAIDPACSLLGHHTPELRFVGIVGLAMLGIPDTYPHVLPALDDSDLRIAVFAATTATAEVIRRVRQQAYNVSKGSGDLLSYGVLDQMHSPDQLARNTGDLFECLERLYTRLPAKASVFKPLVWPWVRFQISRQDAADPLVLALDQRPPSAALPYLDSMSPEFRRIVARLLGSQTQLDPQSRDALLRLVGDSSASVREAAVQAMQKRKMVASDLTALEPLLTRKADDLRRGITALILSLEDADVLASVSRLLAAKNPQQRLAGLELLQQLQAGNRATPEVLRLAAAYREGRSTLDRDEQVYLDNLLQEKRAAWTLDDALGLMDPSKRTPPFVPRDRKVRLTTPAAIELIHILDKAVDAHREEPVVLQRFDGDHQIEPLGTIRYNFPTVLQYDSNTESYTKRELNDLPLRDVWWKSWSHRPESARDDDGLEAARAVVICALTDEYRRVGKKGWCAEVCESLFGSPPTVTYPTVVRELLKWLVFHETKEDLAEFVCDAFECILAAIPPGRLHEKQTWGSAIFREFVREFSVLKEDLRRIAVCAGSWGRDHTARFFSLLRWLDEPGSSANGCEAPDRDRLEWVEYALAFEAGAANEHDLLDALLGPRQTYLPTGTATGIFRQLMNGSRQLHRNRLSPSVAAIVERAIERLIQIELARGEAETIATIPVLALKYAGGMDALVRVLQAIGRDPKLHRTSSWGGSGQSKSAVFSHLVQTTFPRKRDDFSGFVEAIRDSGIDENALIAVAVYAPQWARHVEAALGWDVFADAVWWFHAHTKDSQWRVDRDTRESWNAEIRKLTPLSLEDLMEGAVDVDWFNRIYPALGSKKWERLDGYAKYASGGAGHKRAQLFAQAMLGKVKKTDLMSDVNTKRKQDALRALGLLPLDKKNPKKDLLERYKAMQEFVRTCRQFGSQRQASEKLAARIGQENLSRTAGYSDPTRLQWAMEALDTADLASGPVAATVKDVTVQLAIDSDGQPELSVRRGEKQLKSIPPEAKKNPAVQALVDRRTDLRRSASRMRQSLEDAMCRGDAFTGQELSELMSNVILYPMLERLVFIGEGIMGYPIDGGKGLRDHAGQIEPVKKTEKMRIAHPHDLLASKAWSGWQHDCFVTERVQPFKQVFRELYVLTTQEKSDKTFSARYAGQQVNPRQALALLRSRGWITEPESGLFRVFHEQKLIAWIEFMETFNTPAEVEGLTVEKVSFVRRGEYKSLELADVPPWILSETLRDVDLIVSVAHRGGVDPEASASTVEMRASLLRETVQCLHLKNVRIKEPHVHIKGTHAEYSVHLGSATTHMLPGGALFIVPVHSQHRGRIFLPFADDDPRSAEVLSKVLLLARDQEIRDPNILDQIRSRS